MNGNLAKATAAWGGQMPGWVRALAEDCDREKGGVRKTAAKLKVSPAIVSLAINRKRQKLGWLEARVATTLMAAMVECPALGEVTRIQCLQEQEADFSSNNLLRVNLFRACRNGCPHFEGGAS